MTDDTNNLPVPAAGDGIAAEKGDIEALMADNKSKYWTDPAMQQRYRDLLDAEDSGGKPPAPSAVDGEIANIEALMADSRSEYWIGPKAERLQARYRQLLETRDGQGPAETVANAQAMGLTEADAAVAASVAEGIEAALPSGAIDGINTAIGQLPGGVRGAIVTEFAAPLPAVANATPAVIEAFGGTEAGALALSSWGQDAPRKVAQVQGRWRRLQAGLDQDGRQWLAWLVDTALAPAELAAVFDKLAA